VIALIIAAFFAVEPKNAQFPLIRGRPPQDQGMRRGVSR
jgi:hypothetical protein